MGEVVPRLGQGGRLLRRGAVRRHHPPLRQPWKREIISIGLITSDRKLKASIEGSKRRFYGTVRLGQGGRLLRRGAVGARWHPRSASPENPGKVRASVLLLLVYHSPA